MNLISTLLSLIKANWAQCLLLLGVAALAYNVGFARGVTEHQTTLNTANDKIVSLSAQLSQSDTDRRQAAERQSQALAIAVASQAAEQKRADDLSRQLLAVSEKLATTTRQLKEGIPHALKNDGNTTCGLGPDSLRLYRSGLGYPASADSGDAMPDTARPVAAYSGTTTGPGLGLPPGDLLAHSADYGQWCQQLEQNLIGLNRWHAGRP